MLRLEKQKKHFLFQWLFFAVALGFLSSVIAPAVAQDDDPLEDIDSELSGDDASDSGDDDFGEDEPVEKKTSSKNSKTQNAKKKDAIEDDLGDLSDLEDDSLEDGEEGKTAKSGDEDLDDLELGDEDSKKPKTTAAPDEGVRDILEPDDELEDPEGEEVVEEKPKPAPPPPTPTPKPAPEVPKALQSDEVASTLDPSDELARIPLRPQMSDFNWKKYAGPSLDKTYRIRKKDTLWAISERLFGNPYLWPKVWQLNAQFGNPHQIDPGIELQFFLGNPNSAPILAYRQNDGESETLPVIETNQRLSFLEELEALIFNQSKRADPPFQNFLLDEVPEEIARIPARHSEGRVLFAEGDSYVDDEIEDGVYNIIRVTSLKQVGEIKASFSGYRVRWLGDVVAQNKIVKIRSSFADISKGDILIKENFNVSALSFREEKLGDLAKKVLFTPLDEGTMAVGLSTYRSIGMRFPDSDSGPGPGSLLKVRSPTGELGTLLVVHRSGRLATAWLSESVREITTKDKIE